MLSIAASSLGSLAGAFMPEYWSFLVTRSAHFSILRGQCHEMNIFLGGLNILIITFCVLCADGFQDLSEAFHYLILLSTFYLLLCNLDNAY